MALKLMKVGKAVSARVLFILHSILAVSRTAAIHQDPMYWCLCALLLLLVAEAVMNIYFREANETVGFCPCVFLYLISVVPAIWLIELELAEEAMSPENDIDIEELFQMDVLSSDDGTAALRSGRLFAQVLEQLLLVILVIGRWLLPKGELSRDELSQLLLVYVGTAADIAELFETFKEPQVEGNREIRFAILGMWSWSLLQFTIVLPNSSPKGKKSGKPGASTEDIGFLNWWRWMTRNMDVWGIMISTCLQDGPFLAIRLYLMLSHNVISYMMIFFTCKNTLVLLLQLYRLFVLVCQHKAELEQKPKRLRKRAEVAAAAALQRHKAKIAARQRILLAQTTPPSPASQRPPPFSDLGPQISVHIAPDNSSSRSHSPTAQYAYIQSDSPPTQTSSVWV